jgi:hypothetical protein
MDVHTLAQLLHTSPANAAYHINGVEIFANFRRANFWGSKCSRNSLWSGRNFREIFDVWILDSFYNTESGGWVVWPKLAS